MIAIDTNLLVYAHRSEAPFHAQAFGCVKALAEGGRRWGIPVACLHEFLAVVTHPKVFRPASRFDQALAQVDAWLAAPHVQVLHSGPEHWRILGDLARLARLQGGQFHDARIAAICIENAVDVLWTADRYCSVSFCLELKPLLARMTFCRMSRALLVQMNGLGSVL